jgi:hypothetical protein
VLCATPFVICLGFSASGGTISPSEVIVFAPAHPESSILAAATLINENLVVLIISSSFFLILD